LFIGHEWLQFHNPSVDWTTSTITMDHCPHICKLMQEHDSEDDEGGSDSLDLLEIQEGEHLFAMDSDGYIREGSTHLRGHVTSSDETDSKKKKDQTFAERVPAVYHDFHDLFDKDNFDKLP
ncbi:hypothetical protein PENSPDRAFT_559858, partial [Peniophora sp. CONT]